MGGHFDRHTNPDQDMLAGFRYFASGDSIDVVDGRHYDSNNAVTAEKNFAYYNANETQMNQEKLARQQALDEQEAIREHAVARGSQRAQELLDFETSRQLALMLWQKSRQFGFRLLNPLSALKNHSDLLLQTTANHKCSNEFCKFFNLRSGTYFPDVYTGAVMREDLPPSSLEKHMYLEGLYFEKLVSSGLIYICWSTGAVHVCDSDCTARSVDIQDVCSGTFCAISGIFKGPILDDMPTGRGVKISRYRIDAINAGQTKKLEQLTYHGTEVGEDDDYDDEQMDLEYTAVPSHVQQEEEILDRKAEREEENAAVTEAEELAKASKASLANAAEPEAEAVDEEEEDELEVPEDVELEAEDDGEDKPEDLMGDSATTAPGLKIPKGSVEMHLTGAVVAAAGGGGGGGGRLTGGFELPSDPDARTAHFLKNPEKRQFELVRLVESLIEFESQYWVWDTQLNQEAARAQTQLQSYRNKNKYHQMTLTEQYVFLAAHVATYTPAMPVPMDLLPSQPYCTLILKVWDMMCHSPYVREYNKQRLIPNLSSTALGVLYNMAQGPVIEDCSLSVQELPQIPAGLGSLNVRDMKIIVIPHGVTLGRYLLPLEQLTYLGLKQKKKTQGFRCFKDCLTSTVDMYRKELAEGLKTDPRAAVIRYANACDKLTFG